MSYDVLITYQAYYRCIVMLCFITVFYCLLIRHILHVLHIRTAKAYPWEEGP